MSGLLDIDAVLEKFRRFLEERKNLGKPLGPRGPVITSESSLSKYYQVARRFLINMAPEYRGLDYLPDDAAREYLSILRRRCRPRTVLVAYSALKNLYACMGWPWSIELRQILPEGIEKLSDAAFLKREEIQKVLEYAEEKARTGDFIDIRNVVIAYLIFYGLRPADVIRLRGENVSFRKVKEEETGESYEACVISYTPCKKGRPTTKVLSRRASTWLQRWLGFLESIFNRDELLFAPLIPSFRAAAPPNVKSRERRLKIRMFKPLSYRQLHNVMRELIIGALGNRGYGRAAPYCIRRGIVSYLLESRRASAEDLCKWFGWRSPSMPLIYDKRRTEEIAKCFINI